MTWEIDLSTGTPILVYEKCSVIQDEQAYQVLDALTRVKQLETLGRAQTLAHTVKPTYATHGRFQAGVDCVEGCRACEFRALVGNK